MIAVVFYPYPLLLLFWFVLNGHEGATQSNPNIIFILTDDQSFRSVGYNNPEVKTPFMDSLAKQGVIFQNAYVATPICAASRASILTGLYPQQHGVVALNSREFIQDIVERPRYATFPQLLSDHGYATALYGKSHLGDPTAYGFQQGEQIKRDSAVFDASQKFIVRSKQNNQPFFLWIATHQPHLPLSPPEAWLADYDTTNITLPLNFRELPSTSSLFNQGLPGELYFRDSEYTRNTFRLPGGPPRSATTMKQFTKVYYATISHLDAQIGELLATLQKEQLNENTVIIFLSDNGYFLGNHGLGNKITMHEESTRVPMFVWGPQWVSPGTTSDALVSSLDVYNTVLSLAGIEVPSHVMGHNLLPLFDDPTIELRKYVASECVGVGGQKGEGLRMARAGAWKYMLSGVNEEGLYNLETDPYELNNLAGYAAHTARRQTMRAYLRAWMQEVGDTHEPPPTP